MLDLHPDNANVVIEGFPLAKIADVIARRIPQAERQRAASALVRSCS